MRVIIIERQEYGLGSAYQFFAVADTPETARSIIEQSIEEDDWRDEDDFRYAAWDVRESSSGRTGGFDPPRPGSNPGSRSGKGGGDD